MPATVAEYCGWSVDFAERVDLGGATPAGMVWRAAAAIELGICEVVVMASASQPMPQLAGAPPVRRPPRLRRVEQRVGLTQAEFELPYGNIAQNCGYAMYAQRYHDLYGWDEWARAKIAADQRTSACANPDAVFFGQPLTPDDVLASPDDLRAAAPARDRHALHRRRRRRDVQRRAGDSAPTTARSPSPASVSTSPTRRRPTRPTCPTRRWPPPPQSAFAMAGLGPADMDMVQLYDCYTITALLSIEDSGFCGKGEGLAFVREHDLSYQGDFPCNTHGGQLGFGQAGLAGGMSQVVEAVRQIQGRAGDRQLARHDIAYVTGTGGVMSEQAALVLQGA